MSVDVYSVRIHSATGAYCTQDFSKGGLFISMALIYINGSAFNSSPEVWFMPSWVE